MNQLSHLPQPKQDELAKIVTVIREIVNPAKVILFGSHGRTGPLLVYLR